MPRSPAVIALLLTVLSGLVRAELALPTREPELGVTDASTLGSNAPDIGIAVGTQVPDFTVTTHEGEPTVLAELLTEGPLLVVFYRGGWCPYCNLQIRQMTQAWPAFEARGVLPVLISVDRPDAAALAQRTYEIPFPVLSDPALAAHGAFNVILTVDAETRAQYRNHGIDLEAWSGRNDGSIAVSSAFLVGADGVVRWAHSDLDYSTRPSVEQLLGVIDNTTLD